MNVARRPQTAFSVLFPALPLLLLSALSFTACETPAECLESVSRIEASETTKLEQAGALMQLVAGERTASLSWRDGTATTVTLTTSNVEARWVDSRRNPDYHNDLGFECLDRVRLTADATLQTADGRLRESLSRVAFDARQEGGLEALLHRSAGKLQGQYVPQAAEGKLKGLNISVLLEPANFSGQVSEERESGGDRTDSAAIGSWGDGS